jgi:hypothetical protein
MKKAKIMLSAIAIVAVVAGAFAFKAKTSYNPNRIYYTTVTAGGLGTCALSTTGFTTVPTSQAGATIYYTLSPNLANNNCTITAKLSAQPQ